MFERLSALETKEKGKLIIVEGLDLLGKSTLIDVISSYLICSGIVKNVDEIIVEHQPSYKDEFLEVLYNWAIKSKDMDNWTRYLCFMLNRNMHYKKYVEPELDRNKVVILDRNFLSTFAYNILLENLDVVIALELELKSCNFRKPNLVYILDSDKLDPYNTLLKLENGNRHFNKIDLESNQYKEKVAENYRYLYREMKKYLNINLVKITGKDNPDQIFKQQMEESLVSIFN